MNYVMHFCRNKKCNNGWIDKDLTNAKVNPPDWKYCKDCAKARGIDYDTQTPTSNLTKKELEHRAKILEKQKLAVAARYKNKSTSTEMG